MTKSHLKSRENLYALRFLYGEELQKIKYVKSRLEKILKKNNYEEIIAPSIIPKELIIGEDARPVSPRGSNIVFELNANNGKALALSYENTTPVCSFYLQNFKKFKGEIPKKFFYISNHFRNENFVDGQMRFMEFSQVGWESINGDMEDISKVIATGDLLLKSLKIKHHIAISDVNILSDILLNISLTKEEKSLVLHFIDEKDEGALIKFLRKLEIKDYQKKLLADIVTIYGTPKKVLKKLEKNLKLNGNEKTIILIKALEEVYSNTKKSGVRNVEIDLSLVRSKRFYSGVIFQYYLNGNNHECGGGGEYDHIIKSLGGSSTKACGGAFGLERVINEYKGKFS